MSLINCPECGKEISDKANGCPNCGIKVKESGLSMFITKHRSKINKKNVLILLCVLLIWHIGSTFLKYERLKDLYLGNNSMFMVSANTSLTLIDNIEKGLLQYIETGDNKDGVVKQLNGIKSNNEKVDLYLSYLDIISEEFENSAIPSQFRLDAYEQDRIVTTLETIPKSIERLIYDDMDDDERVNRSMKIDYYELSIKLDSRRKLIELLGELKENCATE